MVATIDLYKNLATGPASYLVPESCLLKVLLSWCLFTELYYNGLHFSSIA